MHGETDSWRKWTTNISVFIISVITEDYIRFFLFRSRNVYLRITDGRKYCYYSVYAWLSTVILGVLAVVAHFMLDYPQVTKPKYSDEQETIGSYFL